MSEFQYRRDVSEVYILGRLVRSQQAGTLSDGGLLGIGDVDDTSVESKVIENQYGKYYEGKNFSKYWIYKSHPGFQGVLYSLFDSYTDFSPARNLSILRLSISLLLSFILGIFCLWIVLEIGWFASISTVISILISKWLALLGGNLFWSMWSFYLPIVIISLMLWKNEEVDNKFWIIRFTFVVFLLSLLKILFSGFEFITAGLLMITVPFVYYAMLNKWKWKVFVGRMIGVGIGLAGSVVVGLVMLGIQVKSVIGTYKETIEYIVFSWSKRTYGYEELLGDSPRASESTVGKTLEVINHYLNGYAFSLSSHFSTTSVLIRDLMDGKYMFLILLFAVFTFVFLLIYLSSEKKEINRTGMVELTRFSGV